MRFDKYEVSVPQAVEKNGYCILKDREVFTIKITNYDTIRCNAIVELDGKDIGHFRFNAGESWELERPTHAKGRFTFCREGSLKGLITGITKIPLNIRGLLQVTFVPEKIGRKVNENYEGGGTVLSGVSTQEFTKAEPMATDPTKSVKISLRLVCESPEDSYKPIPGGPRETPIPPAIRKSG